MGFGLGDVERVLLLAVSSASCELRVWGLDVGFIFEV